MITQKIHFQKKDLSILCDKYNLNYKNYVTNDEDSVTCKLCLRILKKEIR